MAARPTPCTIRKGNNVYVELCSNMYHIYTCRSQEVLITWSLLLPIHLKGGHIQSSLRPIKPCSKLFIEPLESHIWSLFVLIYDQKASKNKNGGVG